MYFNTNCNNVQLLYQFILFCKIYDYTYYYDIYITACRKCHNIYNNNDNENNFIEHTYSSENENIHIHVYDLLTIRCYV